MIFTDTAKSALLQGLKDRIHKGSTNNATLKLFNDTNTLLAIVELKKSEGSISGIQIIYQSSNQYSVSVSGTPITAQLFSDDGVLLLDGLSVGVSNTDIIIDKANVQSGGVLTMTQFTITY